MLKMIKSKLSRLLLVTVFTVTTLLVGILPATPALAATTLKDSHTVTPTGHIESRGINWTSMVFTAGSSYTISRVDLKLFVGGVPGDVTVSIRATSGGEPTGSDLASVTIPSAITSTWTTNTNGEWYTFWLVSGPALTNTVQYAIVLRAPNGSSGNKVEWKFESSYTGGTLYNSTNSGSSWNVYANDGLFRTYSGYDAPTITSYYPTNVEGTTATVWGYLTSNGGAETTISFQYGLTTGYGSETSGSIVASNAWTSKPLSGLVAGETYHYRAKAVNSEGTVYGSDKTLRTANFAAGEIDTNLDYGGLTRNGGRSVFYTKGLYWVFYVRNTAPAGYGKDMVGDTTYQQFGYKTYDESTFSSFNSIRAVIKDYGQHRTSVWFDGTYIHYVTADGSLNYYRRGIPNSNGTITWSAPEQTVSFGAVLWKYPTITVDTNGYPVIGYWVEGVGKYIIRSTSNNGYWITDASFSKTFTDDANAVSVLPLSNGRIYAVLGGAYQPVTGYLWNGSSWGNVESIGSVDTEDGFTIQAVVVNDNVFVTYAEEYVFHVRFVWRDISDNTWKGETEVYTSTTLQGGAGLVYDSTGNMLYLFYANQDTDTIYSKTWQGGVWGSQITVGNESADGLISQGNGVYLSFQSSYYTLGGKLPLVYLVANTPPSILKFNTIQIQEAPEVTTDLPANVGQTSATLQGTLVDDNGFTTQVRFQWGTTLSYGNDTIWQSGYTDGQSFSQSISGLTPNTTYYYRAQGKWADGTVGSGMNRSFTTTTLGAPTITTGTAASITTAGATLQGTLTSLGDYSTVSVYFQYGLTTGYGTNTIEQTKTSIGGYNQSISSLSANTLYHFRSVVRYGTTSYVYGSDSQFTTTTLGAPTVVTNPAASIGKTTVTLQGTLSSIGDYSTVYASFQWGTSTDYGQTTTEQALTAAGNFNYSLTGLTEGATYYYRARARYAPTSYVYGSGSSFTTTTAPPGGVPGLNPPDIFSIEDVVVFTGWFEGGDQLFLFANKIIYTEIPIANVGDYFNTKIKDGAALKAQGTITSWGYRPASIYLSSMGKLVWGQQYNALVEGNPNKWATVPSTTLALSSTNWIGSDLSKLDTWVINLATRMQQYYGVTLTTYSPASGSTVLNSEGGKIFRDAISGLQDKRPHLFTTGIKEIKIDKKDVSPRYQTELTAEKKFGTEALAKFTALGEHIGLSGTATAGFLWAGVLLLVVGGAVAVTGSGVVGSIVAIPLIAAGAFMGLIPLALVAIFAAIIVIFMMMNLWLARS